jgi:molybdopterin-containing oxidoreductase family iron-sulfur binding subunit
MTACQQACPTEAIIFGDLNDKDTHAAFLKSQQPYASIAYGVLTELNTQPRTSYMERLTNKNPALAHAADHPTPPASQNATSQGGRQ